jgi:hypothetical protein
MHPRRIVSPARDKSGGKTSYSVGPGLAFLATRRRLAVPAPNTSFRLQPCDVLLRASQIRPIPANSGFCFPSGRVFFLFRRCPTQPHILPEPQCHITDHHHHTTPHHTTKKNGNPPSGLPLFSANSTKPDQGCALVSAPHSARRQPQPL